jgi:ATP synthase I chain
LSSPVEAPERRLRRNSWLLVAVLSAAGLFLGVEFAASVLAGGALSALNVEGLVRLVNAATSRPSERASILAVLWVSLRYLLLAIGLFVIVSVWRLNVLALSLGLSAPAAAVVLELARDAKREFRNHSDIDT